MGSVRLLEAAAALLKEDAALKAAYETDQLTVRMLRTALAQKLGCEVDEVPKDETKRALMTIASNDNDDDGEEAPKTKKTPAASRIREGGGGKVLDKVGLEAKLLAEGWTTELKTRAAKEGVPKAHVDRYFLHPETKKKYRSLVSIARECYPDFVGGDFTMAPKAPKKPRPAVPKPPTASSLSTTASSTPAAPPPTPTPTPTPTPPQAAAPAPAPPHKDVKEAAAVEKSAGSTKRRRDEEGRPPVEEEEEEEKKKKKKKKKAARSVADEVRSIGTRIFEAGGDPAALSLLLKGLVKLDIGTAVLKKTAIGKTVAALRKNGDSRVASQAKALVALWKKRIQQEEEEEGPAPTAAPSDGGQTSATAPTTTDDDKKALAEADDDRQAQEAPPVDDDAAPPAAEEEEDDEEEEAPKAEDDDDAPIMPDAPTEEQEPEA